MAGDIAAPPLIQSVGVQPGERWRMRFFTVWSGQTLSLIGSALTNFVLMWWITQTTNSASALALAGMMHFNSSDSSQSRRIILNCSNSTCHFLALLK